MMDTLNPSDAVKVFIELADSPQEENRIGLRFALRQGVGMEVHLPMLVAKELFERLADYRESWEQAVPPEDRPMVGGGIFGFDEVVAPGGQEILTEAKADRILFDERYKARREQDDRLSAYIDEFRDTNPAPDMEDPGVDPWWERAQLYAVRKLVDAGERFWPWEGAIERCCPDMHDWSSPPPASSAPARDNYRARALWRKAEAAASAATQHAVHEKFAHDYLPPADL